jgi:HK97 gp10 family phage protein
MAKATVKIPDDFAEKLSKLGGRTDEIVGKVLEAGGEVVLGQVRSNLESVVGKGTKYESRSTGKLQSALGLSKPRVNRKGGHDIKIGFAENRSDGKSNAMLANILEYGKHGQPPKPFLKPAKSKSRSASVAAMQEAFEREVDGL